MKKYLIRINGMTCTGCEQHIDSALTNIGAKNIETSFRRGESVFELPNDINVKQAEQAIIQAKYIPENVEEISSTKNVVLDHKDGYDLLIIGSGGLHFLLLLNRLNMVLRLA